MKTFALLTLIALGVAGSLLITFGALILSAQVGAWIIPLPILAWAVLIAALGSVD